MTDYENIMSAIYIASGLLACLRFGDRVPNIFLLFLAAAMPMAGFVSGMQPIQIGGHLLVGLAALVLSVIVFVKLHFGGAAAKVFAISALWLPFDSIIYVIPISYFGLIVLYWIFHLFSKLFSSENIMVDANHAALFLIISGVLVLPGIGII